MQDEDFNYSEIISDIRKIVRSINLESKKIQRTLGVSIPQLLCLNYLRRIPKQQCTLKELTEVLHLNSSTVTGIINRLAKNNYVERLPKREDKRNTFIGLTEGGRELLDRTPDLLHQKLNAKLSKLPNNELKMVRASLKLLVGSLGIENLDASPIITNEEPIKPED